MKSLKERWLDADGKLLLDAVLKWLNSEQDIVSVGLSKHQDRWDLRGIALPEHLVVRNATIANADLSYATLSGVRWERCRFENLICTKTNGERSKFWSCEFDDVDFVDARLTNVLMNGSLDMVYAGYYKRVKFVNTNLVGTVYTHALFERCEFLNCKLDKVDFNGAQFVDSKFSGKLIAVFFRGYPAVNKALYPDFKPVQNRMERVDFWDAYMEGVNFIDGIMLGSCRFPEGDDYIVLKRNRVQIFTEARAIIETSWDGVGQRQGLMLIDHYFLSKRKEGQDVEFVDRHYLVVKPAADSGNRFFELIRTLNDKWNNAV